MRKTGRRPARITTFLERSGEERKRNLVKPGRRTGRGTRRCLLASRAGPNSAPAIMRLPAHDRNCGMRRLAPIAQHGVRTEIRQNNPGFRTSPLCSLPPTQSLQVRNSETPLKSAALAKIPLLAERKTAVVTLYSGTDRSPAGGPALPGPASRLRASARRLLAVRESRRCASARGHRPRVRAGANGSGVATGE